MNDSQLDSLRTVSWVSYLLHLIVAVGAVFRIHDQTERKRDDAERQRLRLRLLQTERLSALGEMAARIAHEVRNPLVSIGAAAQVIAEELPSDSPVRPEALAIGSEVQRLDRILQNVLRFARPTRATVQRTDVVGVLREVLDLLRGKAHGLLLRLDVPSPPSQGGISALIDGDQLRQVLWNVLINACEAATPGDPLRSVIECTVRQKRSAKHHERPVLITIADSGIGMSQETIAKLFTVFTQADGATTRKFGGSGLGLAISRQLARMMGGDITVTSDEGRGSTFRLTFRAQEAAPAVATAPTPRVEPSKRTLRGLRVLLTDDNAINRQIIVAQLRSLGHFAEAVADGERVLPARNAFITRALLQEVTRSGTAARAQATRKRPDIYGKTGTTNDSMDAWFAGYQPNLAAVVWIGYDNPRKLGDKETGGGLALPVWIEFMQQALRRLPETTLQVPEGVVQRGNDWIF